MAPGLKRIKKHSAGVSRATVAQMVRIANQYTTRSAGGDHAPVQFPACRHATT
jgi:hypothetical protein